MITGGDVTLIHRGTDGEIIGATRPWLHVIPGAADPLANIVEVRLKDVDEPLFMRREQYEKGEGALMQRPTPDNTRGPLGRVAWAWLNRRGYVVQLGAVIGAREDVRPIRMFRG